MIAKLPARIKGRDVHLERIEKEAADTYQPWELILHCAGDGRWRQVGGTEKLSTKDKTKLYNALVNRIWFAGYSKMDLCLRVTEAEGICFRWLSGKLPDPDRIAKVRAKRLEERRKKQKERRKLKREASKS